MAFSSLTIRAVLSGPVRAAILADPWLSGLEWVFCTDIDQALQETAPLVILQQASMDSEWRVRPTLSTVWAWGGWPDGPESNPQRWVALPGEFCLDVLRDRLLAWLWLQGVCCPCWGALPLAVEVVDGSLSLTSGGKMAALAWEHALVPVGRVGGDVLVRVDTPAHTWLVLGDAAGHGEVAALEAALLALAVVACCRGGSLTAQNMEQLNTFLFARIELHRFVAAVVVEINWASGELRWLNAGLPAVLLFSPGQAPQSYPSSSYPFGVSSNLPATTIHRVPMDRCLQLLIHSDGMTEPAAQQLLSAAIGRCETDPVACSCCVCPSDIALSYTSPVGDDMSCVTFSLPAQRGREA